MKSSTNIFKKVNYSAPTPKPMTREEMKAEIESLKKEVLYRG